MNTELERMALAKYGNRLRVSVTAFTIDGHRIFIQTLAIKKDEDPAKVLERLDRLVNTEKAAAQKAAAVFESGN